MYPDFLDVQLEETASVPDYDFTSLSPHDFEILMRDLLSAEYSTRFEAFTYGPDGGVDLRAHIDDKKIIVQCKHYARSKFADLKRAVSNEAIKMRSDKPDRYLLVTTQDLTRHQKDALFVELGGLAKEPSDILARSDVNYLLSVHTNIEKNHFKLWLASSSVLQRIISTGVWERSEALMETVQNRVRLYVANSSYARAQSMLASVHVVAITGAPGVGKSMLSDMLLLAHWEEGWQVVVIHNDIAEAWSVWETGRNQVFFYDDFLGQTDFSERSTKNEPASLTKFVDRVVSHASKRMILTTRSHIFRQAQSRNEPLARSGLEEWQCVVEMLDLDILQRAHVLYNHLYFSDQPRKVVQEFARDSNAIWSLVRHSNFTPRIVEQVIRRPHSSGESLFCALKATFDRPVELWGPSFENSLSSTARNVLLHLVTFPVRGAPGDDLKKVVVLDSTPIEYKNALKVLEGSWISITALNDGDFEIAFANPSCRDFMLSFLDENPDYLETLVSDRVALKNACVVLNYAMATLDDPPIYKFSGLHRYVKKNGRKLRTVVEELFGREQEQSRKFFTGIDAVLNALIEVNRNLSLEWSQWLANAASNVGEADERRYTVDFRHASTILAFVCSYVKLYDGTAKYTNAMMLWLEACLESAESDADWIALHELCADNPYLPTGAESTLRHAAMNALETDLGNLHAQYSGDPEGLQERIKELRTLVSLIGIDNEDIFNRIRWVEEDVSGWFEEDTSGLEDAESEDVDYSARFETGTPVGEAVINSPGHASIYNATKSRLEKMFRQLS